MKVYHGSYTAINEVNFEKSRLGKDFGRGFYVTKVRSQAEYWAKRKGKKEKTKGIVTEFNFIENAFGLEDSELLT